MSIQQKIEATFPDGQRLPAPIGLICSYLDQHGYPISGCFELSTIGMDDLRGWFRHEPTAVQQLLPFGRGATGDVYALWLTDGLAPEQAPVVMFGSEGLFIPLATSPTEFARLLCLGYNELGYDDASEPAEEYEEAAAFRTHMVATIGLDLPETGAGIIEAAKARFPNFDSWVYRNAWNEEPPNPVDLI